jgi:ketosteroid isomerase-like protein
VSEEKVEIVRRGCEAFMERDFEAFDALMREHLASDFEFESVTTGQVHSGPEGMRELITDLADTVNYVGTVGEIIDLDGHVVVMLRMSGRGSGSGVPVAQELAVAYTFEGRMITRGKSYASRAEALDALAYPASRGGTTEPSSGSIEPPSPSQASMPPPRL